MSQYQAYVAGMSMSIPPEVWYLGMAAQNIAAGDACVVIAGIVTQATASNRTGNAPFVPIQSINNSGGSSGSQNIGGVGGGQRVTMITLSILHPFDYVKISATTARITQFIAGTDDPDLIFGKYITEDAAVWSRGASSPYTETLSTGQIPPVTAAANDIVIIELVQGQ